MGTKNCPETPRQKMINMMYLVLLAMMALNVSAEVLDAFKVVDSSLLQTFKSVDLKNNQLYSEFKEAYSLNQTKVAPWMEKATNVKSESDSLIHLVQSIKEEIVLKAGGVNISQQKDAELKPNQSYIINNQGDTIAITKDDELNVPEQVMLHGKRAAELKEAINKHKEHLLSMLDKNAPLRETIQKELDTSDPKRQKGEGKEHQTWESQHFESKPLIAVMTLLSKMQIDIQNSETNTLNYLYSQIDADSYKFNKLGAVVIANSSYIISGETYKAQIFLAAQDTTQQPEVVVNNRTLPLSDGKGIYQVTPQKPGTYSWQGVIKFKTPEGNINSYPFKETYQVSTPSVTISPTKMNVFYLNIANPVSISVPGVPSENLIVSVTNGKIQKKNGQYEVYPTKEDIRGVNTKVIVKAKLGNSVKDMGSMAFRVKRVPDPIATIADKNGGVLRKEDLLAEQGIFATMVDFDFDLKFQVTKFDVTITGSGGYNNTWSSNSNRFTTEQKQQFSKLRAGSIVYIDNITAHGDDNTDRELAPISFKIQ